MKKLLILLSAMVALLGCSHVPTNVDLSSYLTMESSNSGPHARTSKLSQQQGMQHQRVQPRVNKRQRLLQIARDMERRGDYQAAIQRYEQLTDAFQNDVNLLHHVAVLQDKYGDPSRSSRYYLRALHHAPHDADLVCDYGYSRYMQGDVVQAETLLRRAVSIDANLTRGYNNLGLVLAEQGKDREALAAFEKTGLSTREARENLRQAGIAGRLSSSEQPMRIAKK